MRPTFDRTDHPIDAPRRRSRPSFLQPWAVLATACLVLVLGLTLPAASAMAQDAAPNTAQDAADEPSREELQRQIDELREALEALRAETARRAEEAADDADDADAEAGAATPAPGSDRLAELERRLDALAAELERQELGEAATVGDEGVFGLAPAASKIYRTEQGLAIGGYGEMLYERYDDERDDGVEAGVSDELDFLRAIIYLGYKFNDRWLFNSEIEFEHASTGESGSASVEFAYLDYLHSDALNARVGMVLVPMGFVNELHEPTTFLGAKRPDVERVIIPTTWRENGFGLFGDAGDLSYRAYVVNGLRGEEFSAGGLRGGRQKGSQALADDFAFVGRVDYSPTPGLEIGGSLYVGDSGQDLADGRGDIQVGTTIFEGHAEWRWRGLELRALYAQADLDDVARLNRANGFTGADSVGEELSGYYLQAGYDVFAEGDEDQALIPYLRWETYDTQKQVPTGFLSNPANDVESLTLGLAWRPIDQVILKADYQDYENEAGTGLDRINVAIGYIF